MINFLLLNLAYTDEGRVVSSMMPIPRPVIMIYVYIIHTNRGSTAPTSNLMLRDVDVL